MNIAAPILAAIKRAPGVSQAFKDALPATPTPQAWPSVQPRPQPAFTVLVSQTAPIDTAYARFLLDFMKARPARLQTVNSRADLDGRAADIEAQIVAFAAFIHAELEDTAPHVYARKNLAEYANGVLIDLAGDVRGWLDEGSRDVVTAVWP